MSISVNVSMSGTVNSDSFNESNSAAVDTGDNYATFTQVIGTEEEAIALPADISAGAGFISIRNKSTTYSVQIGLTGSYTITLFPGFPCLFPANGAALYAKAIGGSATIRVAVLENGTTTTTTTTTTTAG